MPMESSPDGRRTYESDDVLTGTHRGTVEVLAGSLTVEGTIQGSLFLGVNTSATIIGQQQGSVHVSSGARVAVRGSLEGSATVERSAELTVEAGGKLAGSLHNDGVVVVRGVFGGARSGSGELRFEDQGYEKRPRVVDSNTFIYDW